MFGEAGCTVGNESVQGLLFCLPKIQWLSTSARILCKGLLCLNYNIVEPGNVSLLSELVRISGCPVRQTGGSFFYCSSVCLID